MSASEYYIMHKDIPAGVLSLYRDTGAAAHVEILDSRHMPIGVKDKRSFARWWERRTVPEHQLGKAVLLGNVSRMESLAANLGLSLNDHYWVCPLDADFTWRDVNLFDNDFAEMDYAGKDIEAAVPYRPSASTQGELQKRWVIKNGQRYLVKGNHGTMCRQSINEVFATKLHEMQKRPHASYELVELSSGMGQGIGCMSKNFEDGSTEFIPCYEVTFMEPQRNDISVYEYYIRTCIHQGLLESEVHSYMDYIILSDFLLTNTDRHLYNLGVLRDSDSLQFKGLAPAFDTGSSMFYDRDYHAGTVHDIRVNSFAKTEVSMLNYVKDRGALDLTRIPGTQMLERLYGLDPYFVVYPDGMKCGYEKKVEMLDAFQRGYSLNPRSSHYYVFLYQSGQNLYENPSMEIE